MNEVFRIRRLGAGGDGEAEGADGPFFVPFALPGERVRAERGGGKARLVEVVEPSPDRIAPACRHFGRCGGCNLQHLAPEAYRRWKAAKVADALRARGIEAPVSPMVDCPPASRRRAVMAARLVAGKAVLGFHEAGSHRIVAIEECPVMRPEIVALLPALGGMVEACGAASARLRLAVTWTQSGADVDVAGAGQPRERNRQAMARLAIEHGFSRLTLEGETVVEPRRPVIAAGTVLLTPPPAGFLQTTQEAEAAMAERVGAHLSGCRRVVDLFAGSGAFALRLAADAPVHAVEADAAALAALDGAFRRASGLRPITVERRDLDRRPLKAAELDSFDGLVFDPPRAGAAAQASEIARSKVAKVAAVSCNPATLARDMETLIAGGYHVVSVTPIDQFLWSAHVEVVALLERPGRRR